MLGESLCVISTNYLQQLSRINNIFLTSQQQINNQTAYGTRNDHINTQK